MPTATYIPLQTITLGSSASTVTFGSIPNTYRDLVLIHNGVKTTANIAGITIRFNSDTGSNYNYVRMYGPIGSDSASATANMFVGAFIDSQSTNVFQIMDYSATDKHKTVLGRANAGASEVQANAGRWASTSAVTSVTVVAFSSSFASGSTFSLYGIAA